MRTLVGFALGALLIGPWQALAPCPVPRSCTATWDARSDGYAVKAVGLQPGAAYSMWWVTQTPTGPYNGATGARTARGDGTVTLYDDLGVPGDTDYYVAEVGYAPVAECER